VSEAAESRQCLRVATAGHKVGGPVVYLV
jgi:hypothetical protein